MEIPARCWGGAGLLRFGRHAVSDVGSLQAAVRPHQPTLSSMSSAVVGDSAEQLFCIFVTQAPAGDETKECFERGSTQPCALVFRCEVHGLGRGVAGLRISRRWHRVAPILERIDSCTPDQEGVIPAVGFRGCDGFAVDSRHFSSAATTCSRGTNSCSILPLPRPCRYR